RPPRRTGQWAMGSAPAGRGAASSRGRRARATPRSACFFFKQKTAYEIGLGIPAEPLFRSDQYHENSHAKHWDYHKTPLIGRQPTRSEERFSRNAETDLVCRLLLEKKKHSLHHYNSRDQASS